MLRVYACILQEHDLRLVAVAGLICLLAALTSFSMLQQARVGSRRRSWIAAAGFAAGTGIWSTHFIAMLAFEPSLPLGYDLVLTLLSVAIAVVLTALGWALTFSPRRYAPIISGGTIGAGIAAMHYTGMSAVTLPGRIVYDYELVFASVLIGMILSILAVWSSRREDAGIPWRPAVIFTLAICGLHFTAMGAATIFPDATIIDTTSSISSQTLTVGVIGMALIILSMSIAVVVFDRKLHCRAADEARRLRAFADAAVEGLLVLDGDNVVDANQSILQLCGFDAAADRPKSLKQFLPKITAPTFIENGSVVETVLRHADGAQSEVEVLARPLNWFGRELRVLAVRDISERKAAEARIAHLAYHDVLTGLPNRSVFTDHLARGLAKAAAGGEPVAVLCIDLDGFKAINDLHGHAGGDAVLVEVAQRLRSAIRGNELVARLGGDEFAAVQIGGMQPGDSGQISQRLIKAVEAPIAVGGQNVHVSCSVGIAIYPFDAIEPSQLVNNADMALYRAKGEGRGVARFYETAMDDSLRRRRQLELDLRMAIENDELSLHYQPLADLTTGRICGFEALLRWNHPERGSVGPETFIPVAEESGLIVALGSWVLREACAEAATWQPSLRLAVNLSPVQFLHGDLAGEVDQILRDTGFAADRLDLEVTEGLLIKDPEGALAILRQLKAMGVQISMDDFGTGYSSLSYFRSFPFDKVKIDQSFVRDMIGNHQALAIVRSVIGLGRGLGMPIVAEGVETDEQLATLQEEGCTQAQGYLISRPGPIEHFDAIIVDRWRIRNKLRDAAV